APCCFMDPPPGADDLVVTCHRKFFHPEGDHFTLINIYNAFKKKCLYSTSDYNDEKWCHDYFLNYSALRKADIIRSELLDIIKHLELPISKPAFGSEENTLNIKKALLAGYFMQVARDIDGSGNYIMLTHKQVAQLYPFSIYCATKGKAGLPEWIVFHEFTISANNCIRTVSEISPEMFIQLAPQYYFCNLPPSESKEILQQVINDLSQTAKKKKQPKMSNRAEIYEECIAQQTEERCTIQ
uniref:DEAD-box helicase OB fold domain-containing protein n=1 Tax=Latimeria chalumnae TaxID=7897 RepID=H3A329_LATCH